MKPSDVLDETMIEILSNIQFKNPDKKMKTKKKIRVEKVEFQLTDGSHVVWMKEPSGWRVLTYRHGYDSESRLTTHLPIMVNAIYFASKFKEKKS